MPSVTGRLRFLGILAAAAAGIVGAAIPAVAAMMRDFRQTELRERTRLRSEVLGPQAENQAIVTDSSLAPTAQIGEDSTNVQAGGDRETESTSVADGNSEIGARRGHVIASAHNARFGLLLVDYYAYGLTQARRSFAISMTCSVLGGVVLIAGVALAIFRANSNGEVYAGVVTSVTGVLTTSICVLFHQQANRALKHMEDQTNKLRQDMKAERDAGTALDLLGKVADGKLRARLQAALVLRLSGAELPDADESGYSISFHESPNGDHFTSPSRPIVPDQAD
jgi:hypothetical protein